MLTLEQRMFYRSELITNYYNKQQVKDMSHVRRQVNNMDDKVLKSNYELLLNK